MGRLRALGEGAMIPTRFDGVTNYLGAPPSWDPDGDLGECDPLPVKVDNLGFTSMWTPDSDELAALNAGACVQLTIMAAAHPVVAVGVSTVPAGAPKARVLIGLDFAKDYLDEVRAIARKEALDQVRCEVKSRAGHADMISVSGIMHDLDALSQTTPSTK